MTDGVTLIQCTKTKRDTKAPARDIYDESHYFVDMRAWALARGTDWYVLSAKHGLLAPDEEIAPYDEFGLSKIQALGIAEHLKDDYYTAYVCAGRAYTDHLIPALERVGIEVVDNFSGMKIGERRHELQALTAKHRGK